MPEVNIFKVIGITGLLLISAGVLVRNRKKRDFLFISGGVLMEVYSLSIGSRIFTVLQVVFIVAATYDLSKLNQSKNKIK